MGSAHTASAMNTGPLSLRMNGAHRASQPFGPVVSAISGAAARASYAPAGSDVRAAATSAATHSVGAVGAASGPTLPASNRLGGCPKVGFATNLLLSSSLNLIILLLILRFWAKPVGGQGPKLVRSETGLICRRHMIL